MTEHTSFIELTEEQIAVVTGGASIHIDTTTMEFKSSNANSAGGAINVFVDGEKVAHFPQH